MNKQTLCNNCNKIGHYYHQCRLPITSYGIIVCRKNKTTEEFEFLMIRRKDTFGYIDFMRGKYQMYNIDKIQQLINEMSMEEKTKLLTVPFPTLWQQLCGHSKTDEFVSLKKFELLTNNNSDIQLDKLIASSNTSWIESEWEFPKGRRNYHEKDLDCALREFEEETGYNRMDIKIIENVLPYEEIFIGSNNKSYKHKYFVAIMPNPSYDKMPNHQTSEVSKTEWFTLEQCLNRIRPYSLEKKSIISNVHKLMSQFIVK